MSAEHEVGGGRRGFRRGIVIFAVFVALLATYVLCWNQAGFPRAWRLIGKGMTVAQVEALTGSRIDALTAGIMWSESYDPSLFLSEYDYYIVVVFTPAVDPGTRGGQEVVSVHVWRWNQFAGWLRSLRDPNLALRSQLDPPSPFIYEVN